jgi:hypothetical protein
MAGRQTKTRPRDVVLRPGDRTAALLKQAREGKLDLSDWDIEELMRGRRRSKNGKFNGRPPSIVPVEIHDELARRVRNDVAHELRGIAAKHIAPILNKIMENPGGIDPDDVPGMKLQLQAAQDLMDRFVVGRQERVEVSGTMKHEQIITDVTIDRTFDEDDIEEAVLVDEE